MTRRDFIRTSGVAAAICSTGLVWGCTSSPASSVPDTLQQAPDDSDLDYNSSSAGNKTSSADEATSIHSSIDQESASVEQETMPSSASDITLAAGMLLVTEYAGNSIAVLNPHEQSIIFRIPAGQNPAYFTATHTGVYASLSGSGTVLQIPFANIANTQEIMVGSQPLAICACEDGTRVYAGDYLTSAISVIDTSLASVIDTIEMDRVGYHNRMDPPECCRIQPGVGRRPVFMMPLPGTNSIYTFNYGTYDISTIDTVTGEETDIFDGVVGPRRAVLSSDLSTIFVAGVGGDEEEKVSELYVVDRASGKRLSKIPIGVGVASVTCSPTGNLYAIARDDGIIASIDQASWEVTGSCQLEPGIDSLALSNDGLFAYVGNGKTGNVTIVATNHLKTEGTISGLISPKDILVVPEVFQ